MSRDETGRDEIGRDERSWVERLRRREELFRRAPSAHNTQPWTLAYSADHVDIGWDPARSLPAGDPTRRDLYLAIGAFVETCLIVAAAAGLAVDAVHTGRGVRLVAAPHPYVTGFTADDVAARRVARGPYAPGQIDPAILTGLEPGLRHLPARELADELTVADRWMFGEPAVTIELREWLRLSSRHPRYDLDGLTDRALALSRLEAVLFAGTLRLYPVGRRLGLPTLLAANGRGLLRYDGSMLVQVGTARDREVAGLADGHREPAAGDHDPVGLIGAGRRLMRTWLGLARHGLAVHPLSQLIDSPVTAARLRDRLGATPLAVFRVGRPLATPVRSARLPPG